MMMLAGQSNPLWHYAAGKHPGKVGLLLGPSYFRKQAIREWLPFALDNDAFTAWIKGTAWSEEAWLEMMAWSKLVGQKPIWALVPDVVADREATLENWSKYAGIVKAMRYHAAFAVQDDMTPADIPNGADVVFVGGTDAFKWRTLPMWLGAHPRIHVGRVNNINMVWRCQDLGVESVDGTGWFKDPSRQDKLPALRRWIEGERTQTDQLL